MGAIPRSNKKDKENNNKNGITVMMNIKYHLRSWEKEEGDWGGTNED